MAMTICEMLQADGVARRLGAFVPRAVVCAERVSKVWRSTLRHHAYSELRCASDYLKTCPFILEMNSEYVDILALLSTESTPEEWSCLGNLLWDVGLLRGVEPTCRLITDTTRRLAKSSQAMRERLENVKRGLLQRAQVTLTDIIATEKERPESHPVTVTTQSHALGAMTFVSYLFIYGLIPSKFVFVIGEQLLDISTDLASTMIAVFLTTDKFMALHDTPEWSQHDKFERMLDRVQALADDDALSMVSRKAMHSILLCRERASHEQYLVEDSESEQSDDEDIETNAASAQFCGLDIDDEIENKDPMCTVDPKSPRKIDCCCLNEEPVASAGDFLKSIPLSKWSATDVSKFLVRNDLDMYVEVFASQRIDGDICYHDLSADLLKDLGVKAWHRGKLLRLFQSLI